MRRTKIVCTLGPSVDSREKLKELIDAGMNVARINCSHGDWDTRRKWIAMLRELSKTVSPVGILADLQGPKFRLGDIPGGQLEIKAGQSVSIGPSGAIPLTQPEILAAMCAGARILLGDGDVELKIRQEEAPNFECKAVSSGLVKSHQGVTLPGKTFDTPCITPKDIEDAHEAVKSGVDFLALSYVRTADDVCQFRDLVKGLDPTIGLCAKIETKEGLRNLPEILKVVDLVMVARGDMGLQMDTADVPIAQKQIIDQCFMAGKPVITATQMLESMIHSPRPTRAEATDVANAILDGTDAVMLSGETANGAYPIEAVRTMSLIAEKAETLYDRPAIATKFKSRVRKGVSHGEAVAFAVHELATLTNPAAIITTSTSGQTPLLVSKFRPAAPVLCATWIKRTQCRMSVVWGVESVYVDKPADAEANVRTAIDIFMHEKRLKKGDLVIVTSGVPVGVAGNTNSIMTQVAE